MAAPENPTVGVCYIRVISLLLFIFSVSGAIFLVLYMIQPTPTTTWYPVIGVSLVCFPWFFWFLTILYRIISRACGFRMICYGPFGVDHLDDNVPSGGPIFSPGGGGGGIPIHNTNGGVNSSDGNLGNESGNENENRVSGVGVQPGSPKRVHFGGVVVLGEDDGGGQENQRSPKPLLSPSSSSSSSSSSPSSNGNENERPLRLFMAS